MVPVINFEAPGLGGSTAFLNWIYATHPVETPIPVDISLEWDKYNFKWIYRHIVGGIDYADDIFKIQGAPSEYRFGYPKERLSVDQVYCMGSSVAIGDYSFRSNHSQVPFIPNKHNFIINDFKQEWTFT